MTVRWGALGEDRAGNGWRRTGKRANGREGEQGKKGQGQTGRDKEGRQGSQVAARE